MVGVKNLDPSTEPELPIKVDHPDKPGRTRHHPAVILDLDYWEIVPA